MTMPQPSTLLQNPPGTSSKSAHSESWIFKVSLLPRYGQEMGGKVAVTSCRGSAWSASSTVRACPWSEARRSYSVLLGVEKTGEPFPLEKSLAA